jgi:hypothetical protein
VLSLGGVVDVACETYWGWVVMGLRGYGIMESLGHVNFRACIARTT